MECILFPGQKYVFSGRRKNTNCSNGRYQPFKFYSAELSMCALVKSICREEGQISFNDGSTKEDRHCSCDYTRGYTFLSRQNHQCFCNPGEADCSCYIANCSTIGQLSTGNIYYIVYPYYPYILFDWWLKKKKVFLFFWYTTI